MTHSVQAGSSNYAVDNQTLKNGKTISCVKWLNQQGSLSLCYRKYAQSGTRLETLGTGFSEIQPCPTLTQGESEHRRLVDKLRL